MVDRFGAIGNSDATGTAPARPRSRQPKAEPRLHPAREREVAAPRRADLEKELGNARATIAALKARINALEASAKSSVEDLGRRELENRRGERQA